MAPGGRMKPPGRKGECKRECHGSHSFIVLILVLVDLDSLVKTGTAGTTAAPRSASGPRLPNDLSDRRVGEESRLTACRELGGDQLPQDVLLRDHKGVGPCDRDAVRRLQ